MMLFLLLRREARGFIVRDYRSGVC